jgi:hypothetical protein
MPITELRIHDGKNDPRMLNEGAREQPVWNTIAVMHNAGAAILKRPELGDNCNFVFLLGDLPIKQTAGLVGQSGQAS